jgi:hypothetical protein
MRTIITITESMARRGSYEFSIKRPNEKALNRSSAGFGPDAAAAKAVSLAMASDNFIIIANKEVKALMPKEFGGFI